MNPSISSVSIPSRGRWIVWLGVGWLAASVLAFPASASAQANEMAGSNDADYHYQTPEGANLTYLARRSLQLQTEPDSLSGARLVAAETCVVQTMGADDLILVDEPIVVSGQLMDDCLSQASQLTETQLECWARYLPIRENLDWINPTQAPATLGVGSEAPEAAVSGPAAAADGVVTTEADTSVTADLTTDNSSSGVAVVAETGDGGSGSVVDTGGAGTELGEPVSESFSNWYWWIIAGFVLGLGWYFFVVGRSWRQGPESFTETLAETKKLSQSETPPTTVDEPPKDEPVDDSKPTNNKSKNRRRRSSRKK